MLSAGKDPSVRDRWARLRFSIVGPLMAAPPKPGEFKGIWSALAAKVWRHPVTGLEVRFGASTIERWYYKARKAYDPVATLRQRPHGSAGQFTSLSPILINALTAQYREHPSWTAQLHYDNLKAAMLKEAPSAVPSYSTVRRYLKAQGLHRRPRLKRTSQGALAARDRLEQLEVRSYEVEHVNALWHADFHHGSRKNRDPKRGVEEAVPARRH